jgi:DNA-binding MarR family transcriptional regulator
MNRSARPADTDRTPKARLSEGLAHGIVGYQLALATVVTNQVFDERVGNPEDLRRVEFTILALVRDNPDVTARQLARALAVTPPNVAIWLDRLESRALVARTRSAADGRVQHIRLTAAGAALAERAARALLDGEQKAFETLSAAEHAMLVELLHKVALARRRRDGSS